MALFKLVHMLAAVIWVGGMFFAYVILRPSAAEILQPPERLRLWDKVLGRFFNWVWLAVFLLLVTGFYMVYLMGGFGRVPAHIHWMLMLGILMMVIFLYAYFVCFVRLKLQVASQDWKTAGAVLADLRRLVGLNLILGLATIAVVMLGRG